MPSQVSIENHCRFFRKKEMGCAAAAPTLVCVKRVKQDEAEEWDETMPLPGDIIEGFAEKDGDDDDDDDASFVAVKGRSELSSQLGKMVQKVETIWVKVRRGDRTHKLRVRVVADKSYILHKKYTIRAARDDRHIAVLGDLTLEKCTTLQEMSRRIVNVAFRGFNRKEVKYDWKRKVDTYLPDQASTVVASILFMPFQGEYYIEATISRCMAWFSAAVSSGVPLVFVNIQTEQIVISEKTNQNGKEISRGGKQQNTSTSVELVQGIRLWFLPGVEQVLLEMIPEPGETRFGLDIKRTDEGFICVGEVTKGSAADRAGLQQLLDEANLTKHLLVISRLEGKSVMPSTVGSAGFIHCCDHDEIKDALASAIEGLDIIQLHIMARPNQTRPETPQAIAPETLRPPKPPL
ncbi:hypothetical protein ES319_A06G092200v1 [Gossypium barbadense]|uniref:Plant regulator RWP-RK n=5 Tax=Gossypium TaxID=3633 RepID=A0A1U8PVE0_GOSHI|nr:uncharacterized protein LOC107963005 [Gossypium hirsutum]KAB2077309.1 hypothetical protein ES319_A06G092200v1 [Gossypium barbadense]TYH12904.1 hypothetical protein ES288_A06G103100v1 [Gossypium darwinii]